MIFPSLFYIPKFFEYENVNISKNYTVVRPCQLPIDFTICRLIVLNNETDITNDIFNVTNDISNVTNDISNVTNDDTLSNSTMWKFNKTMIFNSTQLQFTEFRSNKFHKQVSVSCHLSTYIQKSKYTKSSIHTTPQIFYYIHY